jgi:hypothetical protein
MTCHSQLGTTSARHDHFQAFKNAVSQFSHALRLLCSQHARKTDDTNRFNIFHASDGPWVVLHIPKITSEIGKHTIRSHSETARDLTKKAAPNLMNITLENSYKRPNIVVQKWKPGQNR